MSIKKFAVSAVAVSAVAVSLLAVAGFVNCGGDSGNPNPGSNTTQLYCDYGTTCVPISDAAQCPVGIGTITTVCGGGNPPPPPPPPPQSTACTHNGAPVYCQWGTGCFQIDPAYSEPPGQTCAQYMAACPSMFTGVTGLNEDNGWGAGLQCANMGGTAVSGGGDPPPNQTTYTLTTSVSPSGGTISRNPDAASYPAGTFVTVTATPANTHVFNSWTGASTSTSNSVIIEMNGNKTLTANFEARPTQFCCWPASPYNAWKNECHPIGASYGTPDAGACTGDYGIVQSNSTPPTNIQYCLWPDGGCWAILNPSDPNYDENGDETGKTNLQACVDWGTLFSSATSCPNYGTSDNGSIPPPPPPQTGGNIPVFFKLKGRDVISNSTLNTTCTDGAGRSRSCTRTTNQSRWYIGYSVSIGDWQFSETYGRTNGNFISSDMMIPAGTYTLRTSYLENERRTVSYSPPYRSGTTTDYGQVWSTTRTSSITLRPGFRYEIDVINGTVNTLSQ